MGKIFVGGVARDVDEGILTSYFSQFGNVCLATVMRDKFGISRGFGFVAFDPPQVAADVLKRVHVIEGRTIEIKQAVKHDRVFGSGPRERGPSGPSPSQGDKEGSIFVNRQVYVGGLPYHITEKEVREYFEQFGPVVSANLKYDFGQQPPKFRGFGFVNFVEEDSVEKCLENYSSHQLGGKWIEVKRSKHSHVVQGENSGVIMPQMVQGAGSGRGGAYDGGRAPASMDPYGGAAVKDPYGGGGSGPVRPGGFRGASAGYRASPYGSSGPSIEARPKYSTQPATYGAPYARPSPPPSHGYAPSPEEYGAPPRFDPYQGSAPRAPAYPSKSGGWRSQQPLNQL